MKRIAFLLFVLLWVISMIAYAQEDDTCSVIVKAALETTNSACEQTERNQACFGNIQLVAEIRKDVTELKFEQQGDMIDVIALETLTLSSMDTETQEWGVALLRLQANLPDTLPGQNVTFLLFGDVELENAVDVPSEDDEDDELLKPMQAFYFKSGIGDSHCEDAPDSGILIQTPEGAGEVMISVNEVNIILGSTAYIQAQPEADFTINLVEGDATVEAFGVERTVMAGERVRVPLDNNLRASGPPSEPEPYDENALAVLPLDNLERVITLAPAVTTGEVETAGDTEPNEDTDTQGDLWTGVNELKQHECGSVNARGYSNDVNVTLVITSDTIVSTDQYGRSNTIPAIEQGVYEHVWVFTSGDPEWEIVNTDTYTILNDNEILVTSERDTTDLGRVNEYGLVGCVVVYDYLLTRAPAE